MAVGENSEWGKTMALMEEAGQDQTPLQEKLEGMATAIGKVGLGVAVACFIAQLIKCGGIAEWGRGHAAVGEVVGKVWSTRAWMSGQKRGSALHPLPATKTEVSSLGGKQIGQAHVKHNVLSCRYCARTRLLDGCRHIFSFSASFLFIIKLWWRHSSHNRSSCPRPAGGVS